MPFDGLLEDNTEVRDVLDYITESLESSALGVDDEHIDIPDDDSNQPARLTEPRADQQMQRSQAIARRSNQYHPRDEE
jgi:hypothetical protein